MHLAESGSADPGSPEGHTRETARQLLSGHPSAGLSCADVGSRAQNQEGTCPSSEGSAGLAPAETLSPRGVGSLCQGADR